MAEITNVKKRLSEIDILLGVETLGEPTLRKEKPDNNPLNHFIKAVNTQEMVRYSFMDQTKVFPGYIQNLKHMDPAGGEVSQTMYFNTSKESLYVSNRRGDCIEVKPVDILAVKKDMEIIREMRNKTYKEYIHGLLQSNHNREKSPTGDTADEFLYQYTLDEEERAKENNGYVPFLNALYYRKVFKRYSDFKPDTTDKALQTYVYVPSTDIKGEIVPKNYSDREEKRLQYYNVFNKTAPELVETQDNLHHGVKFQKNSYLDLMGTRKPILRIVTVKTYPAYVWRTPEFLLRIKREMEFLARRVGMTVNRRTFYTELLEYLRIEIDLMEQPLNNEHKAKDPERDMLFLTEETDIDIDYIKQQQETNKTLYLEEFDLSVSFIEKTEIDHPYSYLNAVYYQFQSQLDIPFSAGLQINIVDNRDRLRNLWVNFGHDSLTVHSIKPIKDSSRLDGLEYIVKLSSTEEPVRIFIPLKETIRDFIESIKEYGIYETEQDAISHARHSVGKEQVDLLKSKLEFETKKEVKDADLSMRELDLRIEKMKRENNEAKQNAEMQMEKAKAERDELLKRQEFEYKERENTSKKTIETYKVIGTIAAVAATVIGAAVTIGKVFAKAATVAVAAVSVVKGLFSGFSFGLLGLLAL